MVDTPDQRAAEKIGGSIDAQIFRLQQEDAVLANALTRRTEIAAELAVLQIEKARIDGRRPPRTDVINDPRTR